MSCGTRSRFCGLSFGASIATEGSASYREFLLPGIQAQTIVFTAFVVSTGITADVEKGIITLFTGDIATDSISELGVVVFSQRLQLSDHFLGRNI